MKLYSGPLCIFGNACRIVLQEKTIEYEAMYVQPGELESDIADMNR